MEPSTSALSVNNEKESETRIDRWQNETWRRVSQLNPALTLENSGSVARDHLASERTFLAYVRTSLGFASMGVALVQLFSLSVKQGDTPQSTPVLKLVTPLGAATITVGLIFMAIGFARYFRVQKGLLEGHFTPARNIVVFMSGALSILIVIVFAILVGISG